MPPSPLTVTLIQSTILNAISNILAQLIDRHKENVRRISFNFSLLFPLFPVIRVEVVNTPIQTNQNLPTFPSYYLTPMISIQQLPSLLTEPTGEKRNHSP